MNIKTLITVLFAALFSEISAQRISTEHEIIDCGYIKYGHLLLQNLNYVIKGMTL